MMSYLEQSFQVRYNYRVYFTSLLFDLNNTTLFDFFKEKNLTGSTKVIFVIDSNVLKSHPFLVTEIMRYFKTYDIGHLADKMIIVPGGETAKNNFNHLTGILRAINTFKIDRHCYLAAIGGGAVLDTAGFAASIAHRGIKHLRIPTTVLSQNDSGVGVKNGINAFARKNSIGTFSPPDAVFNDDYFLSTISDRDRRAGIAEAIKVALIKNADFFYWIENNAENLLDRHDKGTMNDLIKRCAELHLAHISGDDPFEKDSARPLDFGHWSAHKLEKLSGFEILHGEAVAMGIALDTAYAAVTDILCTEKACRIFNLLLKLGFCIDYPEARIVSSASAILDGLEEFREHLGGSLSIPVLTDIGKSINISEITLQAIIDASSWLQSYKSTAISNENLSYAN